MDISITYRHSHRMTLRIGKDGTLLVSVPCFTSKRRIEKFIEENRKWIEKASLKAERRKNASEMFFKRLPLDTKTEKKEAEERLKEKIEPLVSHYSPLMGVSPSKISYHATKTRWGSCNTKSGNINFSLYLLLLPDECIEHTVVHELAHLLVPNHGTAFHSLMDKYYPSWRTTRKLSIQIFGTMSEK